MIILLLATITMILKFPSLFEWNAIQIILLLFVFLLFIRFELGLFDRFFEYFKKEMIENSSKWADIVIIFVVVFLCFRII